jgi:prepilin-type N-terminal cleavage/methylation domain-containing protein
LFTRHHDHGFTLIELLLAIALLAIIAIPLAAHFGGSYAGAARASRQTEALNLCREKIETIKAGGCSRYLEEIEESSGGNRTEVEEHLGRNELFQRETRLQIIDYLHDGDPDEALILINVKVSWPEGEEERTVQLESYISER